MKVSVVVTTYNWPAALDRVLDSLARQTHRDFEVIVADDGSGPDTAELMSGWIGRAPFPLQHAWQEDEGFRAARVRNLGASKASGDYLIFIDGDCLTLPGFVASHAAQAERGWFATGRRAQVRERATAEILEQGLAPYALSRWRLLAESPRWLQTRYAQLLTLPVDGVRRTRHVADVRKAESCNLGLWRDDFLKAGGFDESFEGFGCEDVDLCLRLLRSGLKRKSLEHLEPVLHLYHGRKEVTPQTRRLLEESAAADHTTARASLLIEAPRARRKAAL
ncbi:MAG TPA: glycosyltransferase family 2 protein [Caulobacteraceae bacterium]|nr:glycosyltransferase family 2 protein [Caulobacteraceae bacterium]